VIKNQLTNLHRHYFVADVKEQLRERNRLPENVRSLGFGRSKTPKGTIHLDADNSSVNKNVTRFGRGARHKGDVKEELKATL
jgi:hypothetical protein